MNNLTVAIHLVGKPVCPLHGELTHWITPNGYMRASACDVFVLRSSSRASCASGMPSSSRAGRHPRQRSSRCGRHGMGPGRQPTTRRSGSGCSSCTDGDRPVPAPCMIPLALPRNSAYCISMTTSIESLRTFAEQHGEIEFAHLCTAALAGEEWAVERVQAALARVADRPRAFSREDWTFDVIHATDTTHPDGAIARSVEI